MTENAQAEQANNEDLVPWTYIAAGAWTHPTTSSKEMDPELALVFAKILRHYVLSATYGVVTRITEGLSRGYDEVRRRREVQGDLSEEEAHQVLRDAMSLDNKGRAEIEVGIVNVEDL